jgi:hypothetical protein
MPPAGFEPEIPASERLQSYVFDRTAIGIGMKWVTMLQYEPERNNGGNN